MLYRLTLMSKISTVFCCFISFPATLSASKSTPKEKFGFAMAKTVLEENRKWLSEFWRESEVAADDWKAGCNTFEHITAVQYSDCLYILWRDMKDIRSWNKYNPNNFIKNSKVWVAFDSHLGQ